MLNCIICAAPKVFQFDFNMSASTYLLIGIIIWLVKVFISFYLVKPSCARYPEPPGTFVLLVFFSPNIVFWPINIILDIYSVWSQYFQEYSTSQIIHAIVGF